jgi:DNA primase
MITFSKGSLELLRSRIDLIDVLTPHLKIEKRGSSYKAVCPFHEEKTPSFHIQKGDNHYHCFGCGAHGDAIQFLMTFLRMSFHEAVETLAERFGVQLEEVEKSSNEPKGPPKALLKDALERACRFYQFCLLHTSEGQVALDYLYRRGIDLSFIREFRLGYAPPSSRLFQDAMREYKISHAVLKEAGLFTLQGREFFFDRVTIPILDAAGSVIGFSARAHRPLSSGPKYINTPETVLFKKSKVLFGLSYSRKRIAKEKKVLIVEGQIDALRLIYTGFNWTVAGQGTAFGEDHVREIVNLGVRQVTLALDGDRAGREAAVKIGHLFQKEGIEVWVATLPEKCDPDVMLRDKGPEEWQKLIDASAEYLPFLIAHLSKEINPATPAGKNELVQSIAKRIREWDHPLMVHESLRKLARLTQVPEAIVGGPDEHRPREIAIQQFASVSGTIAVDPDRILEADLLRWLIVMPATHAEIVKIAELNIRPEHFRIAAARVLYEKAISFAREGRSCDLLALSIDLENPEQQMFLAEILQKRINREKATPGFIETVQRILERAWMHKREEIKLKIYSGSKSEADVLQLAKEFDEIKRKRPEVQHG